MPIIYVRTSNVTGSLIPICFQSFHPLWSVVDTTNLAFHNERFEQLEFITLVAMAVISRSPELISLVISHLIVPDGRVSTYATVSREWHDQIERHTFSTLLLTPARLSEFRRIMQRRSCRRANVRVIKLDIVLDPYDAEANGKYETSEEQQRNNEVFTQSLQAFFGILSSWSDDGVAGQGILLFLRAYSPGDVSHVGRDEGLARRRRVKSRAKGPKDLLDRRFAKSYLRLIALDVETKDQDPLSLPVVSAITQICIIGEEPNRNIWPASGSAIAASLPRLRYVEANFCDCEKKDLELRKRARAGNVYYWKLIILRLKLTLFPIVEFGRSLALFPSSVKEFRINYVNNPPRDETYSLPNLTGGDEDIFSAHLREFSQRLTTVHIDCALIGSELFWPINTASLQPPHWPHLTYFYVNYSGGTPSGQWLFERDPDDEEDDIEESQVIINMPEDEMPLPEDRSSNFFRKKASPSLMNGFYLAAGRAAAHMPCLKHMELSKIHAMGQAHWFKYEVTATKATATWGSTPSFTLEEKVLEMWREVARKHTSTELEVKLVEEYERWGPVFAWWCTVFWALLWISQAANFDLY